MMRPFITEEAEERRKEKQDRIRELKKKCNTDEHGHQLYLTTINLPIKLKAYTYSSNRIPVGFYCPICGELYNLECKKCKIY